MESRHTKAFGLALVIILMSSAGLTFSKPAPKNKSELKNSYDKPNDSGTRIAVDIFIGNDQDTIRRYFHDHAGSLPPGLAKRDGDLPPGLQKQLKRKGQLPPGLAKKVSALPVELERQLPPLKTGLVRGFIEGRAVIFDAKTSFILDIFSIF